jgi:L-asparagine transporter-like permease
MTIGLIVVAGWAVLFLFVGLKSSLENTVNTGEMKPEEIQKWLGSLTLAVAAIAFLLLCLVIFLAFGWQLED